MKKDTHWSAEDRAVLMIEYRKGSRVRAVARLLGRSASTVSRELSRNSAPGAQHYEATRASRAYRVRRRNGARQRKLFARSVLYRYVHDRLVYWRGSPQQMAARLRRMHPDDPDQRVSHETIDAAIYAHPRGELKQAMIDAVRQEKTVDSTGECNTLELLEQRECCHEAKTADLLYGNPEGTDVGTMAQRRLAPAYRPTLRSQSLIDPGDPCANRRNSARCAPSIPAGVDLSAITQTQLNDIAKLLNGRLLRRSAGIRPRKPWPKNWKPLNQRNVALDS